MADHPLDLRQPPAQRILGFVDQFELGRFGGVPASAESSSAVEPARPVDWESLCALGNGRFATRAAAPEETTPTTISNQSQLGEPAPRTPPC